jgi:hypothetical protein
VARSEKRDKRLANRAQRAAERVAMTTEQKPPDRRETSDVWTMEKDGKRRFDPAAWPKGMRK